MDPTVSAVIRAWNLLGGLELNQMDFVMDLIGLDDPELLVHGLSVLRDHFRTVH